MRTKQIISMGLILSMLMSSGCGNMTDEGVPEAWERTIELKEPSVPVSGVLTEKAILRDIYIAEVYEASVYPEVTEYSFSSNQKFDTFVKFLGDEVSPGDVLVKADSETIDAEVEMWRTRLSNLQKDYAKLVQETNETIEDAKDGMEYYAEILENMQEMMPTDTTAADYATRMAAWEKENKKWQGEYNWQELLVSTGEEDLRQKKIIYDIDYAYYSKELQEALTEQRGTQIVADVSGTVVGAGDMQLGKGLLAGMPVIAVAWNEGAKYIKCEYIYRLDVLYNSKDVYAFIDGQRYELTYVDDGNEEVTTFILQDENNEIAVGSFASIVLENKKSREQVVAVPKEAVYGTIAEYYVYVVKDGKPVKTVVKTGSSDGVYTEIISGVNEGDLVQIPIDITIAGSKQKQLVMGGNVREFNGVSLEFFPVEVEIANPFSNVNVYFVEYLVSNHDFVAKGDPIARIRVEGSMQEVYELELEIQRDRERLQDDIELKDEDLSEKAEAAFWENIEKTKESIAQKEERLKELKAAHETTIITSPVLGFVKELKWFPGETLLDVNDVIATISDAQKIYLTINDNYDYTHIGDYALTDITIRRTTETGWRQTTVQGSIVSLDNYGLSHSLQRDETFIKVRDENTIGTEEYPESDEDILRRRLIENAVGAAGTIKATVGETTAKHSVLVPVEAVTVVDGATYVNVLREDGTVERVSFLAGGNPKVDENYWVIKGLAEGMTICWE